MNFFELNYFIVYYAFALLVCADKSDGLRSMYGLSVIASIRISQENGIHGIFLKSHLNIFKNVNEVKLTFECTPLFTTYRCESG